MTDRMTVNLVVVFLGLVIVMCVAGGLFLAFNDKSIPDAIIGLGSASLGALGALLANPGTTNVRHAENVDIANQPAK